MIVDDPIVADDGKEYSIEEIKHSNRIVKSTTPKGTLIGTLNGLPVYGYL